MSADRGSAPQAQRLVIEFPLRGVWLVTSPPSHPRYAFDIVAVDAGRLLEGGVGAYLRGRLRASASLSWSAPVTSPISGVVVAASDGTADRDRLSPVRDVLRLGLRGMTAPRGLTPLAGNHVVVESDRHRFLLAHLRRGSVTVAVGDRVAAGDLVGQVGNSGNSIVPHLHIQTLADPGSPFAGATPFDVHEYELWRNRRWEVVRMSPLPRFGRVRAREAAA